MKLFWVLVPQQMKKFHAFTIESGVSLCKKWFVGFAKDGMIDYDKNYGKNSKCIECIKKSTINLVSNK